MLTSPDEPTSEANQAEVSDDAGVDTADAGRFVVPRSATRATTTATVPRRMRVETRVEKLFMMSFGGTDA
jgi:hypothetical protein